MEVRNQGNGRGTATADNLIWYVEHCVRNELRMEGFIRDAESEGHGDIADFFREARDASRRRAEHGKDKLVERVSF